MRYPFIVSIILCLSTHLLHAQDEIFLLSPFEVAEAYGRPAISLKKPADFITLSFTLTNDARLPEARTTEIYETVKAALARIGEKSRIEIQSNQTVLKADNLRVETKELGKDTTAATLYARIALTKEDSAEKLTYEMIDFVKGIEGVGRTLVDVGQPGLSVVNPEKYRYELLKAIVADIRFVREAIGPDAQVALIDIQERMRVDAAGHDHVELWLPYSYRIYTGNPTSGY